MTHVLLDLDGTLSDSSLGIGRSLQHAFSVCGYEPPTDEQVRSVIGPPFELSFPTLGIPVDDIERVVAVYRERYEDIGLFENDVYPGDRRDARRVARLRPHPLARHGQTAVDRDPHRRALRVHRLLHDSGRRHDRSRFAVVARRPR